MVYVEAVTVLLGVFVLSCTFLPILPRKYEESAGSKEITRSDELLVTVNGSVGRSFSRALLIGYVVFAPASMATNGSIPSLTKDLDNPASPLVALV